MNGATILMYHQIVANEPREIHAVNVKAFAAQMKWLSERGYEGASIEEVFSTGSGRMSPSASRRIAITFDDGYLDVFTNALPILKSYGFRATVFLVADRIGGVNDWDGDLPTTGSPLLDWNHINEMSDYGICFGSHTNTHPDLTSLSIGQARDEVQGSRQTLEAGTERSIRTFAYPYSRSSKPVVKIVSDCGYDFACTYTPDHAGGSGNDRLLLQRVGVLAQDTVQTFAKKIQNRQSFKLKVFRRAFRSLMNHVHS